MGKPTGEGGPWLNTPVRAGIASDPYLFGGYGLRSLNLSHTSATTVNFRLQLDATGDGVWFDYRSIQVPPSKSINFNFPDYLQSKWIRLVADQDAIASAQFEYK